MEAARTTPNLEILPASHRDKAGHVRVDFEAMTIPDAWLRVLDDLRVDAVVNCVGIWSGTAEEFERIQYTVPVALFDACNASARQVVHLSALGFSERSPLPYASTKARADRYLLQCCGQGTVVYPSLVFGPDGRSTRFFLDLAALPVQVDFGLPRNLQPVHVDEVARAVVAALTAATPARVIECAGTHAVSIPEYFAALRTGLGLRPAAPVRWKVPLAWGRAFFTIGEAFGRHFVNQQTWTLLQTGTRAADPHPEARPYEDFASPRDLDAVRQTQLYWFARLGVAFLWLWTAAVTWLVWPRAETMSWLSALHPALATPFWLGASCALDAAMGLLALFKPSRLLWQAQAALTAAYTAGLAIALPSFWAHPFGPLTKNVAVLATMLFLVIHEQKRER